LPKRNNPEPVISKKVIGILLNPRKDNVDGLLNLFDNWADAYKDRYSFLLCTFGSVYITNNFKNLRLSSEQVIVKSSELLITLGGDGTLLRAVNILGNYDVKILGVNLGGLGFLANTPPEKLLEHTENFISGNFIIDERTMFQCRINGKKGSFTALNDVVVDKAGSSRVIQIATKIDGKLLNSYIADGLIISTATGSTGYSLSAGGPIITPNTNVIILNPICPHSLSNRPVVIDDHSVVTVQVWTESETFHVLRDGTKQGEYASGSILTVKKFSKTIKFVQNKSHNFFKTLSKKLSWGEDFRDKNRWTYQKDK
jgi:NAD+ kinase